ncbi:MAG: acylphosphatase [Candidatus Diapherotrites archaeon]|nr:acylphosphatase [Candidatus Diapherotrites archaeon]
MRNAKKIPNDKTLYIVVEGRVQGVFFRKFVKESARLLGVKGFVRNLEDGRVEAVCSAEKEILQKLLEKIKTGPPFSRVENVSVKEIFPKEKFGLFEIQG